MSTCKTREKCTRTNLRVGKEEAHPLHANLNKNWTEIILIYSRPSNTLSKYELKKSHAFLLSEWKEATIIIVLANGGWWRSLSKRQEKASLLFFYPGPSKVLFQYCFIFRPSNFTVSEGNGILLSQPPPPPH